MQSKIENGIGWLDANHPGWRSKVNVDTLDMSDASNDVLAQAVDVPPQGGYKPAKHGYTVVFNQAKGVDGRGYAFEWMRNHGFIAYDWTALQEGWVEELHRPG